MNVHVNVHVISPDIPISAYGTLTFLGMVSSPVHFLQLEPIIRTPHFLLHQVSITTG